MSGTAYDNSSPRIVAVDGFDMDLRPKGHLLIMRYPDRPGYVGKFGSILGSHDVNIARMEVGRTEKRGQAIVAMTLDECPDATLMATIRNVDGVVAADLVSLG